MADKIKYTDLKLKKAIGRGSYGDVYKARWKTEDGHKKIAAKTYIYYPNSNKLEQEREIEKEAKFLSELIHENIVTIYGTTRDDKNGIVMLMEYADCGSLHNAIHKEKQELSHDIKISWMYQCAKAIEFLHNRCPKVIHRDIKPQNMLLFDQFSTLKICDFGTVKELVTNNTYNIGTAQYIAPEVGEGKSYSEKCDVYSYGITLWEVISRKKPFYHLENGSAVAIQLDAMSGRRPHVSDIPSFENSDRIIELIEKCWHQKSEERPTMQQVIETLESLYGENELINKTDNSLDIIDSEDSADEEKNPNMTDKVKWDDILDKELIGKGFFSKVYRGIWRSKDGEKTIAVKRINCTDHDFQKNIELLSHLEHKNIVTIYDIIKENDNTALLLMEYAECGTLHSVVHETETKMDYSDSDALEWMYQFVKGMAYMHDKNIIHCDLKPRKLLLMNKFQTLKICGWDTKTETRSALTMTAKDGVYSTSQYMAPEIFLKGKYTKECDIYSFAFILWEVLSRKRPFDIGENSFVIFMKATNGDRPDLSDLNNAIKGVIDKCWHSEPDLRPPMKDLIGILGNIKHIIQSGLPDSKIPWGSKRSC